MSRRRYPPATQGKRAKGGMLAERAQSKIVSFSSPHVEPCHKECVRSLPVAAQTGLAGEFSSSDETGPSDEQQLRGASVTWFGELALAPSYGLLIMKGTVLVSSICLDESACRGERSSRRWFEDLFVVEVSFMSTRFENCSLHQSWGRCRDLFCDSSACRRTQGMDLNEFERT